VSTYTQHANDLAAAAATDSHHWAIDSRRPAAIVFHAITTHSRC